MDLLLEATRRAEQQHFWFRGFRRFVHPLVEQAVAGRPAPEILDCGCGTGNNLVMLGAFGRASGFDLSWDGLEFARDYGQRRLARASITEIPFASGRFDLVTAFDVLYSLPGEAEGAAIRELYRVLKPGGHLIVNVAALNILRGNHSVFGGEVRRSSRRRLRRVLSEGGFEILRLTYTNFTLFPLMLVVRTGQRLIGLAAPEDAGTDIAVPPAPVNAALSALLALEAGALRHVDMPVGSSLLCLARKNP
jgi:SAM-dependent methyltransferase